ncbi:MAG: 30S ribosome-binding factor RbfA [Alphaproteobacteria bacterium]
MKRASSHEPTQRQLRVGEEIRHALALIFSREELHDPTLQGVSLTFSEVRVSPDLKNATVFFLPLGGQDVDPIAKGLVRATPHLRGLLAKLVRLRLVPRLRFIPDQSFAQAEAIDRLLRRVGPIAPADDDETDGPQDDDRGPE